MRLVVVDFSLANASALLSAFASDPGVTVLALPVSAGDPWGVIASALSGASAIAIVSSLPFLIFIAVLLFRPQGLFGGKA